MTSLTQVEIDRLVAGFTQPAAQVRYLRSLGLQVLTDKRGRPAVARWPTVASNTEPNIDALRRRYGPTP